MTVKLIINPKAKSGQAKKIIPELLDILSGLGFDIDLYETRKTGDGICAAREAVGSKYETIVAAGGDGTVNEVVNGMVGSDVPLGIIPLGTINVFAQEIGLSKDLKEACQILKEPNVRQIDLGKAGDRYFILCAGAGFDAQVVSEVKPALKKIWGAAAYPMTGVKTLFNYKPCKMSIQVDDHPLKRKGYFVVIGNIRPYAGKNISITPEACFDDGLIDLCIFKKRAALDTIRYALGILLGRHTKFADVEYLKAKRVKIETERPILVHTDCEVIGETPMEFCVVPKILNVVFPKNNKAKHLF